MKIPTITRKSSYKDVRSTLDSLKRSIETEQWPNVGALITLLHEQRMSYSKSTELSTPILHVFLRVLKIVREEALKVCLGGNADFEENSTNRLFASGDPDYGTISKSEVLDGILNALDELLVDINSCSDNISDLSLDFIHSDELVLTRGFSQAAYRFLRRAAEKKRMFKAIVCEGYPENMGHKFAKDLAQEGVNVILVPDSHVFGLMSRVNKVIIGCDAVYPDGTLQAPVGTYGILLAAKYFSVPTYVCLPQYKLSPIPVKTGNGISSPFNVLPCADPSNESPDWLGSPDQILPHSYETDSSDIPVNSTAQGPVVWVPRWEKIPAGLVSLFLTNLGSHAPSYLYALGRELFHSADIETASIS